MLAELFLVVVLIRIQIQSPEDPPVVVVGEVTVPTANIPARPSFPSKKQKPVAKLVCSPRLAISYGLRPALVLAKLYVDNPGEHLWCPGIEWYIDSDLQGGHESDCPPYETVLASQEGEVDRWSEDTPKRFSLMPGEYVITAKLTKSGKTMARVECRVLVK